jgi:5-methylcytosine-specific restriction endonuclease McrA
MSRKARSYSICSRCKAIKPPTSFSYCRPCASAYYLEQKALKGTRTYPSECYRCGKKKSVKQSLCGSCSWKNTRANRPAGYATCSSCGAEKAPSSFRFCNPCSRSRSADRRERIPNYGKRDACSRCKSPKPLTSASYCGPCERDWSRSYRDLHPEYGKRSVCCRCGSTKPLSKAPYCNPCTRVWTKSWRKRNPEKITGYNRVRRARLYDALGSYTVDEWKSIVRLQRGRCAICRERFSVGSLTADHKIPLSKGGCNFAFNIQALCKPCNSRKNNTVESGAQHTLFDRVA